MCICIHLYITSYLQNIKGSLGFPDGAVVKNSPDNTEGKRDAGSIPGQEDTLEEGLVIHSSILVWKIPWTEKPREPQSIGLQRARHD